MSNTSSEDTNKPSIYIDTCIARDITERRRDASIELIHRIKREAWSCRMSVLGVMELVDTEQENIFVNKLFFIDKRTLDEIISSRRNRNLEKSEFEKCFKYIKHFRDSYPFIELVSLDDDGWSLAIVIASYANLHASDVIHLVTAWQADCDVIVTNDTFFISEAQKYLEAEGIWDVLRICTPEKCYSVLGEMGYSNL